IILISSCAAPGRIFKLIKNDYLNNKIYFENKKSYVGKIKENTVKILSFYLPQFHPIPENDEWHGKGFTEWTKVKASTPLFKGHYQQHRPHEDIGYYLLDSPAILKKQASLMRDAGVHGQIFYHYWFSGKLILEEPVKILLENKDVEMPFCFCWANENWTKRWDGNDAEVLLAQHYSASDARDFINYLIPFLKDERYIKIAGRPVLYIYRPSSIPDPHLYIDIWNKICAQHGIPPLYITAILTRGAHDPRDYGMDGALERVLHDWTGGNTSEIKDSLQKYWPVNGSVLDYGDVATYYAKQDASKEFEYFRSLVPTWDNTARYGSESYVVHESTPEKFQGWLEQSIAFTKANLPEDRHLVVINAWNEWAEGAHLEPDTYSGYAYLNSVGRALSGIKYQDDKPTAAVANTKLVVEIELPEYLTNNLNHDKFVSAKFFRHLAEAIKNYKLTVFIKNTEAVKRLKELKCNVKDNPPKKIDCTLQFRQLALISDTFITEILKTHNSFKDSVIISNEYGRHHILQEYYGLDSVTRESAYENSVILIPSDRKSDTYKISHKARAFSTQTSTLPSAEMPEITTVIRFHKNDSILELKNALLSLSAVHSCVVKPVICAQDLKPHQLKELTELCAKFEYKSFTDVKINKFFSSNNNGDIRAKLLHEGLKAAESRYVAFLDHDDLMMCNSYAYLVNRLNITGKAVSFGRVYDTAYESNKEKLIKRNKTYEYGFTYNDFLDVNHAPLHSFLMDTTKVDISSIHYFEDQKFMEDYYLTLQIFDGENTDWASLQDNFYVGDYLHCTDRSHTLAITDTASRSSVITNTEFEKCKKRVEDLKLEIKKKLNSH
ncbi:glycosyltransferase, partial [Pseudomonas syringae]